MISTNSHLSELQAQILESILTLAARDLPTHGFAIAKEISDVDRARKLTAHGTLYKALGKLSERGLVDSEWIHEPEVTERPPRREYHVTGLGERVLDEIHSRARADAPQSFLVVNA